MQPVSTASSAMQRALLSEYSNLKYNSIIHLSHMRMNEFCRWGNLLAGAGTAQNVVRQGGRGTYPSVSLSNSWYAKHCQLGADKKGKKSGQNNNQGTRSVIHDSPPTLAFIYRGDDPGGAVALPVEHSVVAVVEARDSPIEGSVQREHPRRFQIRYPSIPARASGLCVRCIDRHRLEWQHTRS